MRWLGRLFRWLVWTAVACVLIVLALFVYDSSNPPLSTLMVAKRLTGQAASRTPVALDQISPNLISAVLMSEDAQFCTHNGVDWDALREVMQNPHGPSRGASTITMQTAKNLFLWPGRSYIRKALEIPIALALDAAWSKGQILMAYLNVAEWGQGVFGAEAAARYYFRKPASQLNLREAALLASALPNPALRNPTHPTRTQRVHVATVLTRMKTAEQWLGCLRLR